MTCTACLPASDKGGRVDVKNDDKDCTVSNDGTALACRMCVLGSGRDLRYIVSIGWRSFYTLRCFKFRLRLGAMGGRIEDDPRRDRFPGNTDSRYVPVCRHHIAKNLYPDDLRNSRDTTEAYPEWVCLCFQRISKYYFALSSCTDRQFVINRVSERGKG